MMQTLFCQDYLVLKLRERVAAEIFQFSAFEQVPHALLRVQFRNFSSYLATQ